ncbi:MAG: DUF2848 domain-containing protein [Gammaproteobacteria bacterium]|nr:DUF2848 domain-containing protein [Gammaproteobacteria bacterium]
MTFQQPQATVATPIESIHKFVIAGWTGRDPQQVRKHIEELQVIGVKPPSTVPVFYEVFPSLMTTATEIGVVGLQTSGEVEFVLLKTSEGLFVTVGSDHTDRWLEATSVHHSKQVCAKPASARAWPLSAVIPQWDQLILRSYSVLNGRRRLYQEGCVTGMLAPEDLIARYERSGGDFSPGTAMSCGTLALRDGMEFGERFELEDPVCGLILRHSYRIKAIEIAS